MVDSNEEITEDVRLLDAFYAAVPDFHTPLGEGRTTCVAASNPLSPDDLKWLGGIKAAISTVLPTTPPTTNESGVWVTSLTLVNRAEGGTSHSLMLSRYANTTIVRFRLRLLRLSIQLSIRRGVLWDGYGNFPASFLLNWRANMSRQGNPEVIDQIIDEMFNGFPRLIKDEGVAETFNLSLEKLTLFHLRPPTLKSSI